MRARQRQRRRLLTQLAGTAVEQLYAATGQVHDFRGHIGRRSRGVLDIGGLSKGFGTFWGEPLRTGPSAMPVPRRKAYTLSQSQGIGTDHHTGWTLVQPGLHGYASGSGCRKNPWCRRAEGPRRWRRQTAGE